MVDMLVVFRSSYSALLIRTLSLFGLNGFEWKVVGVMVSIGNVLVR